MRRFVSNGFNETVIQPASHVRHPQVNIQPSFIVHAQMDGLSGELDTAVTNVETRVD